MDPLLCFPADLPAEVTLALQSAGLGHHGVGGPDEVAAARARRPDRGLLGRTGGGRH